MMVKIHFENLAAGMKAKIDPSYRTNNSVDNLKKSNGSHPGSLGDKVIKFRSLLVSEK
jgi:hypothetical protein